MDFEYWLPPPAASDQPMKAFVSILAAAVLGGLGAYFLFDWLKAFSLLQTNVVINVSTFVGFIAVLAIAAAALATLFYGAIARADHAMVRKLEARIRALEQVRPDGPAAPAPAPPPVTDE